MGGRGSGGSRGGGNIGKEFNVNSRSFTDTVKDKMANLSYARQKVTIIKGGKYYGNQFIKRSEGRFNER